MLIFDTVIALTLPAISEHVPLTDRPAPCVEIVVGAGGLPAASPDTASVHTNVTVTGEAFHPFASGGGVRVAVIVGPVLSTRTVIVFGASALPATSTPKNVMVLVPSAVITMVAD